MSLLSEHTLTIEILQFLSEETAASGTTTTNVTIANHGLETGDFMVNTDRRSTSNLSAERGSRAITLVDNNNFTISPAISGQTTGDTILLFKFADCSDYVKDGSFSMNLQAENETTANFQITTAVREV